MNTIDLKTDSEERQAYLSACRRELHRIPEVGFELPKTCAIVERELDRMGIPHTRDFGPYSVVADLGPAEGVPVIAFRADMDALPVEEKTGLPFSSEHPGAMHACGHDSHMAMLLGAARTLKPLENELPFRLRMIFQPAEESAESGAKMMIDNHVLDGVDYVLCQHVAAEMDVGTMGYTPGTVCSACYPITITFHGKTSHATLPQHGSDAIAMMFKTYSGIQLMLSREIDPFERIVCSVGVVNGGHVHNVICDNASMTISLRTFSMELGDFVIDKIRVLAQHAAEEMGGTADVEAHMSCPAVENDDFLTECIQKAGESVLPPGKTIVVNPRMSSDDFAWFSQKKPSLYFYTGVRNLDKWPQKAIHNNDFMLDEDAMLYGETVLIAMLYKIAERA